MNPNQDRTKSQWRETINGIPCTVRDIGCPNKEEARRNREHLSHIPDIEQNFWKHIEATIAATPFDKPLPKFVPQEMPYPVLFPTKRRPYADN